MLGRFLSRIKRKIQGYEPDKTRQEKGNYILSLFDTIDIVRLRVVLVLL